jgi:hypothetical protein
MEPRCSVADASPRLRDRSIDSDEFDSKSVVVGPDAKRADVSHTTTMRRWRSFDHRCVIVDILFAFWQVSTKPDPARERDRAVRDAE